MGEVAEQSIVDWGDWRGEALGGGACEALSRSIARRSLKTLGNLLPARSLSIGPHLPLTPAAARAAQS